jgi:hypothetical protein
MTKLLRNFSQSDSNGNNVQERNYVRYINLAHLLKYNKHRCDFHIQLQELQVLIEVFHTFSQALQANVKMFRNGPEPLHYRSFPLQSTWSFCPHTWH